MTKKRKTKKKSSKKPTKTPKARSLAKGEPTALPTVKLRLPPKGRRELRELRGLHLSTVAHWPKETHDRARRTPIKGAKAHPKKKRRRTSASSKVTEYLERRPRDLRGSIHQSAADLHLGEDLI